MGGEETEVSDATTSVLLEAANFEPVGIWRSSERMRLRTEGSNRWEKGVDPYLAEQAAAMATELIVELTGARWTGHADVHGELPDRPLVPYRPEKADAVIGMEVARGEQEETLERLGCELEGSAYRVPTWRARDLTREIDLVEEVARFVLADVPFTLPLRRAMTGRLSREQRLRRRLEDVLVGLGFNETVTPSLRLDDADPDAIALEEPISIELAVLRTELLPSLVDFARRNADVGNRNVALFEVAHVYLPKGNELPDEPLHVAGIVEGGFSRGEGSRGGDLRLAEGDAAHRPRRARAPSSRQGRRAPRRVSSASSIPPFWTATGAPSNSTSSCSWPTRAIPSATRTSARTRPSGRISLSSSPEDVPAADLVDVSRAAVGHELREMRVFDVYHGPQVGEGRKSLAFSVEFQSPERTLSDEDAAVLRQRIVDALRERFGAELRTSRGLM